MDNVLFVIEDEDLLNRIQAVFNETKGIRYFFASESKEAIEKVRELDVAVAVLSLSIPVMNGNEIAEYLSSNNVNTRFIFIYRDIDTELAVEQFNTYSGSQIFEYNSFRVDELKPYVFKLIDDYSYEAKLKARIDKLNEKELGYRRSIKDMNGLLESRRRSYKETARVYLMGAQYLFKDYDSPSVAKVIDYLEREIDIYVGLFLFRDCEWDAFFDELSERCSDNENYRFLKISVPTTIPSEDIAYDMMFCIGLLCDAVADFMESYRGKVVLEEYEKLYRLDVRFDLRAGNCDAFAWEYVCEVINNLLNVFAARCEAGSKDGIDEFRMYFYRSDVAIED